MNTKSFNEVTASTLAGLHIDLNQKLRNGVISLQEFEKFLNMSQTERREKLGVVLTRVNTRQFFNNGDDGNNGIFRIWFGSNVDFKNLFLSLLPEIFEALPKETILPYEVLPKAMNDFDIRKTYGDKILKSPERIEQEMHCVMTSSDKTFADGKANIWYFERNGRLFCVYFFWLAGHGVWDCYCHAADTGTWDAGNRVFFSAT